MAGIPGPLAAAHPKRTRGCGARATECEGSEHSGLFGSRRKAATQRQRRQSGRTGESRGRAPRSSAGATALRAAQSVLSSSELHAWDAAGPGPSAVPSMASAVAFAKSQFRWTVARRRFFRSLMWINGFRTPASVFLDCGGFCVQVRVFVFEGRKHQDEHSPRRRGRGALDMFCICTGLEPAQRRGI